MQYPYFIKTSTTAKETAMAGARSALSGAALSTITLFLATAMASFMPATSVAQTTGESAPSVWITDDENTGRGLFVAPVAGASVNSLGDLSTTLNVELARVESFRHQELEYWTLAEGEDPAEAAERLLASGAVGFVERDFLRKPHATPNDSRIDDQWYAKNIGGAYFGRSATAGADMNLTNAWNIETGDSKVVIAVIDNGVDLSHPDLVGNLWRNSGEIPANGKDDDGNGFVDDIYGWDFGRNDANPHPDTTGRNHGTAVAGTLGASGNNGEGIAGANWNVSIMVLKTDFSVSATIKAMEYALENGADIINTSFGGSQYSNAEYRAIRALGAAGVLMVASAGNEHWNNDFGPSYPGSYDLTNILAVSATTTDDSLTSWSQHGQISVDVAAPGDAILTTEANGSSSSNRYGTRNGTSFSSPLTAGVAGLLKAANPTADYSELKGRIFASVDKVTGHECRVGSSGRVNAGAALEIAPQPVPVITALKWIDNGNERIDSNETGELEITFETLWQAGGQTALSLVSTSNSLIVEQNQQVIAAMPKDLRTTVRFPVQSTELSGHENVEFSLKFTSAGFATDLNFCVLAAPLTENQTISETLQTHRQDDVHRYTIEVPAGMSMLDLQLAASNNLDLYVRYGFWPNRDQVLRTSTSYISGAQTHISAGSGGSERINISNPNSGTWHVMVVNASQRFDSEYSLASSFGREETGGGSNEPERDPQTPTNSGQEPTSSGSSGGGGGGGGGGSGNIVISALLLGALLARRRKRSK